MLCAATKADSVPVTETPVGPTWQIVAEGIFSGPGPGLSSGSEAFALDWTVSFVTFPGMDALFPTFSGTTTMVGVLGTVNETMQNALLAQADQGYLAFIGPAAQAEIDITTANYYPYGLNPLTLSYVSTHPPVINVPYVYSCFVPSVCAAYGTGTGNGLFAGQGTIVQTAREVPVATPEPGPLPLLLSSALLGLPFVRRRAGRVAA
jgi:hypothetical protein